MIDSDFGTFDRALRRISGAFQLRVKPGEWDELARTYFKLFEGYPIEAVLQAGKICMRTLRHFPRPVEWLEELDRPRPASAQPDARQMTATELGELTDAEQRRYEGDPCACEPCVRAGVRDRPVRYVPTLLDDGTEERAYHPRRQRVAILGHWAHGDELRRWYVAREAFFARTTRSPLRHLVLVGREPGEEG